MNAIARTVVIGSIESRERKMVNEKKLAEFRIEGIGLRVAAWGDLADKVPETGLVMVEGALRTRKYQVEGKDRTSTEIIASSIEIIEVAAADASDNDDDLPF